MIRQNVKQEFKKNYFCIMCHSTMLDYHFSKFELIYSVYYYFSYLFYREIKKNDEKNTRYFIYKSKDILVNINNFYIISKNKPNMRISYFLQS